MLPPVVPGLMSGGLYRAAQCIMGHIRISPLPWTDRMTDTQVWKHYLPVVSLEGYKNDLFNGFLK